MNKSGMKIEEVAMRVGVSVETINRWYREKKNNPGNEFLQALPCYELAKNPFSGVVRFWTSEDVWKLIEFKSKIKVGRTGQMGKYGGTGSGKKKDRVRDTVESE